MCARLIKMQANPMASPAQERGTERTVHSRQCGAAVLGNMRTEWEYCRTVSDSTPPHLPHGMAPTVFVLHVGINYQAAGSPRSSDKAFGCPSSCSASPRAEGMHIFGRPITHSEHVHIL